MMYAVRKKVQEKNGIDRRRYAEVICKATTKITRYFVKGSGPHSFVILASQYLVRENSGAHALLDMLL